MDSLRIALLVKALPLHRPGGQERHAWDLARGLVAHGHRVTVVTTAHPAGEAETSADGVRIIHLAATAPGRNSAGFFLRVARWVRAFDGEFDVFHAQGFAALLARPRKTPLVTTVHGTVWSETPLARGVWPLLNLPERLGAVWRFKTRFALQPLIHRAWGRSRVLICDSEFTRSQLMRGRGIWRDRIHVVPLGVEPPGQVPDRDESLDSRPIRLLSVGRLERVKGLQDLLRGMAKIPDPSRLRLTVVGDGPHREPLARLAASLNLCEFAVLLGRVEEETLARCWAEADLFVNPEWSHPAFGLVNLEALGWGLPVLGTRTGATPEIVTEDVGWLVPPGRPDELAAHLARLASAPGAILDRRPAARRRAEVFPVSIMVDGTVRAHRGAL